jgi:Isoprenylcysteine carboxyl methyltransferase (ICMT) family
MALRVRLLITLTATLVFLGLAIRGWGGFAAFFAHPARIALAIVVVALTGVALFSGGNLSAGEREDRANRWVLVSFAVMGLLDAYLPAYTERKGVWILDGDTVRWLGVVLFAVGGALRLWPVFVLGRRFSGLVAIQPEHTLVTNGIYGVIRSLGRARAAAPGRAPRVRPVRQGRGPRPFGSAATGTRSTSPTRGSTR